MDGRVEAGLRSMGLLYGSEQELADILAHGLDDATAVRTYLVRKRPQLLASYDLDALVEMVLTAGSSPTPVSAVMEQFGPR